MTKMIKNNWWTRFRDLWDPNKEPRRLTMIANGTMVPFAIYIGYLVYVLAGINQNYDPENPWDVKYIPAFHPSLLYIIGLGTASVISAFMMASYIVVRIKQNIFLLLFKIVCLIAMFITNFAFFYTESGLYNTHCLPRDAGCGETVLHNGGLSLYFSTITLSTVGYGDYIPADGASRMAAAIEAVSGYFLLALLIAALTNALKPKEGIR